MSIFYFPGKLVGSLIFAKKLEERVPLALFLGLSHCFIDLWAQLSALSWCELKTRGWYPFYLSCSFLFDCLYLTEAIKEVTVCTEQLVFFSGPQCT